MKLDGILFPNLLLPFRFPISNDMASIEFVNCYIKIMSNFDKHEKKFMFINYV